MIVLGLTGSIGMGKTAVARMFSDLGVPVFDSDAEAHRVLETSKRVVKMLKRRFPQAVQGGKVDRKKLGAIVFADPKKLRQLEVLIHPAVMAAIRRFLDAKREKGTPLVVVEVPLLYETGLETVCDYVAVVSAGSKAQRSRVLSRAGMDEEILEHILARQIPDEEKQKRADFVIPTNVAKTETRRHVEKIKVRLEREGKAVD